MCKLQSKTQERKVRLKEHQSKQKEQLQHCQQLRTKLQVLRLSKQEQGRLNQKSQVEKEKREEILKVKRQKSFRVRQRAQWAEIKSYRRNQEEIKAERRFHLHQELKATVKRRRQQALQVRYYYRSGIINFLYTYDVFLKHTKNQFFSEKNIQAHCSKSSFFVQKFNLDIPRKLSIFLW